MSVRWTDTQRLILIKALKQQKDLGKGSDTGMKKEGWIQTTIAFNLANDGYPDYTKDKLQTQNSAFRSEYSAFKNLLGQSGFGWNANTKTVTALPGVWDAYLESHPSSKKFRYSALTFYEELHELFDGNIATGRYASSTVYTSDSAISLDSV